MPHDTCDYDPPEPRRIGEPRKPIVPRARPDNPYTVGGEAPISWSAHFRRAIDEIRELPASEQSAMTNRRREMTMTCAHRTMAEWSSLQGQLTEARVEVERLREALEKVLAELNQPGPTEMAAHIAYKALAVDRPPSGKRLAMGADGMPAEFYEGEGARTRRRMVELSIPAGADPAQLVERIGAEMAENERLRETLIVAWRYAHAQTGHFASQESCAMHPCPAIRNEVQR